LKLAYALNQQGKMEEVIQNCEKAIEINPKYYNAYHYLALAL
jgi:Tfp pilus assembly protein PilF